MLQDMDFKIWTFSDFNASLYRHLLDKLCHSNKQTTILLIYPLYDKKYFSVHLRKPYLVFLPVFSNLLSLFGKCEFKIFF